MAEALGYLWPTQDQMLLIHAALGDKDTAAKAFARWCERTDLAEHVDVGSMGLLPLVHANIGSHADELPGESAVGGLITGVRRRGFVEAHRAIASGAETLALLDAAGIRAMATKGVLLALAYYAAPGLRPMDDADILVERDQAEAALEVLERAGWRVAIPDWRSARHSHMKAGHAVTLERGPRAQVDLHWRLLLEIFPPETDRQLWANAVPIAVGGAVALRPDANFLLMQVLLHGLRRNSKAPLRWIPDAVMILRRDGAEIDWDWLLKTARDAKMFNRLGLALRFLHANVAIDIPEPILRQLEHARPTVVERLENQFILGTRPLPIAMGAYRMAVLLRMVMSRQSRSALSLVWRKLTRGALARHG